MRIFILFIIFFLSSCATTLDRKPTNVFGKNDEKDSIYISDPRIIKLFASIAVVYDRKLGFGRAKGNFGSGWIAGHRDKYYLITAAHVIGSKEDCRAFGIVRNYNTKANILSSKFLGLQKQYEKRFQVSRKDDGSLEERIYYDMPEWLGQDDAPLKSGHSYEHNCIEPLVINKELDFAVFRISEPLNSMKRNKDLSSFRVEELGLDLKNKKHSVFVLHHAAGRRLNISDNCVIVKGADKYNLRHNCDTYRASSGAPILSAKFYLPLGMNIGGPNKDLDELNQVHLPDDTPIRNYDITPNLRLIIPSLKALLNGDDFDPGIRAHYGSWMSIDGKVKIKYPGNILSIDGKTVLGDTDNFDRAINVLKKELSIFKKNNATYSGNFIFTSGNPQNNDAILNSKESNEILVKKIKKVLSQN